MIEWFHRKLGVLEREAAHDPLDQLSRRERTRRVPGLPHLRTPIPSEATIPEASRS